MVTILGFHISIIRPSLIKASRKLKDAWRPRYNKRPKTKKFTEEELDEIKKSYHANVGEQTNKTNP